MSLFTNRKSGYFGEQNVTRTGAKYTQILIQLLNQFDDSCLENCFTPSERDSLSEVLLESSKWYRGNYIKNVNVSVDKHNRTPNINITLGRNNGTMGSNNNLNITFQSKQVMTPLPNC